MIGDDDGSFILPDGSVWRSYYNMAGEPISRQEMYTLWEQRSRALEKADPGDDLADPFRVASSRSGDVWVSTVFLGMNHTFDSGPPLIWETMVFGGDDDGACFRYSTLDEALEGHQRVCVDVLPVA